MQNTIIAVRGVGNAGKTTSVRLAYQTLRAEAAEIRPPRLRSHVEVRGAILIIDGVLVGFASAGDIVANLEEDLDLLRREGCTVIVCTARDSGKTPPFLERFASSARPPFRVLWLRKIRSGGVEHRDRDNRRTADEIIAAVRRAIAPEAA
jgi:hypothetical protein